MTANSPHLAPPSDLAERLRGFRRGGRLYQYGRDCVAFTEGVKYLAEQADAFWLIDAIASRQGGDRFWNIGGELMRRPRPASQIWSLTVHWISGGALLECRSGEGMPAEVREMIPFAEFPLTEIDLYVRREGEREVLMLPSER